MNYYIKQILLIGGSFLIILYFQYLDDKKNKKKRNNIYDIIKFPILVSSLIGLLLNINSLNICNSATIESTNIILELPKVNLFSNKDLSDQQIYTDLPDF